MSENCWIFVNMPKAGKNHTLIHSFSCALGADNRGFPGYFQRFHTRFCAEFLIVIKAFLEAAKRYVRGGYDVVVDGIANWFIENELEK